MYFLNFVTCNTSVNKSAYLYNPVVSTRLLLANRITFELYRPEGDRRWNKEKEINTYWIITLNSLINELIRINEYEGKIFSFITWEYVGNFSHLLHKKFESVVEKNSKKQSEHAHLLGSSEYVDMQMHAIMQILGSMYICKRF